MPLRSLHGMLLLVGCLCMPTLACEVLEQLRAGKPMAKIIIVTHPLPESDPTGNDFDHTGNYSDRLNTQLEGSPNLEDGPILQVTGIGGIWSIPDNQLPENVRRRTVTEQFPSGSLDGITVNARQIHLAGGACGACLSRTFNSVAEDFVRPENENESIRVTLHLDITYGVDIPGRQDDQATEANLPRSVSDGAIGKILREAKSPWKVTRGLSLGGDHSYKLSHPDYPEKSIHLDVVYEARWDGR